MQYGLNTVSALIDHVGSTIACTSDQQNIAVVTMVPMNQHMQPNMPKLNLSTKIALQSTVSIEEKSKLAPPSAKGGFSFDEVNYINSKNNQVNPTSRRIEKRPLRA
eukprot:GEZU01004700.1.p1 GENE.GEZU01004700.1~~GEZU01004700.1.p1  ORF type:complete len:106 (-),score=23.40 GEZU01004700.1:23-340(-)